MCVFQKEKSPGLVLTLGETNPIHNELLLLTCKILTNKNRDAAFLRGAGKKMEVEWSQSVLFEGRPRLEYKERNRKLPIHSTKSYVDSPRNRNKK